MVFTQFMFAVL